MSWFDMGGVAALAYRRPPTVWTRFESQGLFMHVPVVDNPGQRDLLHCSIETHALSMRTECSFSLAG